MNQQHEIESRKKSHVEVCLNEDVQFKSKSAGFDGVEIEYNALPEIDFADVDCSTSFLQCPLRMPLMISGMTGGYADAEKINRQLAEVCETERIAIGVGSQRQALKSTRYHESYRVVRTHAPSIPRIANIGAAEVVADETRSSIRSLVDLIEASALAVHLNPLQELLQAEGSPRFRGVLHGIESLVKTIGVPVVVKEVGAGISVDVARKLLNVGVQIIDVAGAGGTSWAGVELLRKKNPALQSLWDAGIPTVECIRTIQSLRNQYTFSLIASGGVKNGFDVAKSIALGSDISAAARPFLVRLMEEGQTGLQALISEWKEQLQASMFISGAATISVLGLVKIRSV